MKEPRRPWRPHATLYPMLTALFQYIFKLRLVTSFADVPQKLKAERGRVRSTTIKEVSD
jgi:hypothetical protein